MKMTSITLKSLKLNERSKSALPKPKVNCDEFTKSNKPDLKDLDNFMFVEYYGQRHTHPQRVRSAKEKNVSSLKITYFTSDHISYMQRTSDNLQRLDLSYSNLFKLPFGIICNMNQLQILILDNNQLNEFSFCKEFCNVMCNSLKELSICSNNLSCWPENIDNLNKLIRLKITNNALSTIKGIDKFKKLKLINFDFNQLFQLGNSFYSIKRLEYAYLSHNSLSSISVAIKHLVYLKELDLSFNSLKSIPSEIFLLQNIEIIKLNDNKITKIPKFKITSKLNKTINMVDLSSNNIVRFPDYLMRITEELDLSNNKIRLISSSLLKKIPYTTSQKLYLFNNPLCSPPKEICESGLKCMIQFQQESETISKNYTGLKVFCLGSENIKKPNIIAALIDQNDEEDCMTDKEHILEIHDTAFELTDKKSTDTRLLNIQFVDIFSENNDTTWFTLFMTCPALIILFVDVDNYSKEYFNNLLGIWMKQVIIKQNEISFLLAGVTNNKNNVNQSDTMALIKSDVTDFFNNYIDKIIDEIYQIESQAKINASMSLALKKFIQLKSIKVSLHEKCLVINTRIMKSIKTLQSEIITLATKTNVFSKVMSLVPSFWSDVQLYFEEESYKFPLMNINEYEILLQQKFNLKPAAFKIANFLHEIGYFLWWENARFPLNQWIVTCPLSLVECLRILYRPDLKTYLEDSSDPDRILKRFKKNFSKSKYGYRECCNILFNKSILLPELAIVLWETILPLKSIIRMLYYLCECWSLGYLIDFPQYPKASWSDLNKEINESQSETISSVDSIEYRLKSADSTKSVGNSQQRIPPIFLPCFLKRNTILDEYNEMWNESNQFGICASYKFALGLPKIISDQILNRANNSAKIQTKLQDHWTSGIQGVIESTNLIFRIYFHQINENQDLIKYEFRCNGELGEIDLKSESVTSHSSSIWQSMLIFLIDTDEFLDSYKGLWYERLIDCPYCKQESFSGTWNASSDSLLAEDKICQLCGEYVHAHILNPPQINKNISSEDVIKNIRRQYDRD